MFSPFAINRSVVLWGANAEEFKPELWTGRADEAAATESYYMFLTFWAGPRGSIRNVFADAEFKCFLGPTIGRFEFEPDGRREVIVKAGPKMKPRGICPLRLSGSLGVNFSFSL